MRMPSSPTVHRSRARTRPVTLAAAALSVGLTLGLYDTRPAAAARFTTKYQCMFNSDCASPLLCTNGFCRAQCITDRDCRGGDTCVVFAGDSYNYCRAPNPAPPPNPTAFASAVRTAALVRWNTTFAADASSLGVQFDGTTWQPWGGEKLKKLAAGGDGEVWALTTDDRVLRRDGDTWSEQPGQLRRLHVADRATICGLTPAGEAVEWTRFDGNSFPNGKPPPPTWTVVALPKGIGPLADYACGSDGSRVLVEQTGRAHLLFRWRNGYKSVVDGSLIEAQNIRALELPGTWQTIDLRDHEFMAGLDGSGQLALIVEGIYTPALAEMVFVAKGKAKKPARVYVDVEVGGDDRRNARTAGQVVVVDSVGTPYRLTL